MFQIVLTTCPDLKLAKVIAKTLVKEKLVACVNILPNVTSVYQWQEQVMCEEEVQLILKTTTDNFPLLAERIKVLHSYDVPEIIALNIQQGDKHYLNWITQSMK